MVAIVIGCLLALLAMVLLAIGSALAWANATQRDDAGYFASGTHRLETLRYAITSDHLDLGLDTERGTDLGDLAEVRIRAASAGERPVFVGIGPSDQVDRYLRGVSRARIDSVSTSPFRVAYRYAGGGPPRTAPGDQAFWAAAAQGSGQQTLRWSLESGDWKVVIMNADGAAGVAVDTSVGVKATWLEPLAISLLAGGGILLVGGASLLVIGVVGLRHHDGQPVVGEAATDGASPVRLVGHLDPELGRWLWLVKWLLVIPHLVVLLFLWVAFGVLTVVAGFAILVTGRYPRGIFDFNVGVLRWSWRVSFYAYGANGTDRYPPFSLAPDPAYPASFDVEHPTHLSRGLVLVKWWLLAIPQYVVVGILLGGTRTVWTDAGDPASVSVLGLLPWLVFVAVVVLLVTGRYSKALFGLIVGLNRWVFRVVAYAALLTDVYPPFQLDQGPEEPALLAPPPPPPADPVPATPAPVGPSPATDAP